MSLSPTHTMRVLCKYYWSTEQRDSYANEAHMRCTKTTKMQLQDEDIELQDTVIL
jgi:hypothetical protein